MVRHDKYHLRTHRIPNSEIRIVTHLREYYRLVEEEMKCPWCGGDLIVDTSYFCARSWHDARRKCFAGRRALKPASENLWHDASYMALDWAVSKTIEEVPFEDLPLYIDVEGDYSQKILTERLDRGI